MSRVKKVVLFFVLVFGLLLLSTSVQGSGSVNVGGTFVNSDQATFKAGWKDTWEEGKWQRTWESDYIYKKANDIKTLNEFYGSYKANYTFAPKHYVFAQASYDYDEFREDGDRKVSAFGYGIKLLRTDKFKVSNEFSIGYLNTENYQETIWRNSLWFFFKLDDKYTLTNKFLYTIGDRSDVYIRNQTSFNYLLTDKITVGLSNTYTEDPIDNNVLSINLGYNY